MPDTTPIARLAPQPSSRDAAPRKAAPTAARANHSADALSALLNLGYSQSDAAQAVATIAGEAPDAETPELIRRALKLLMPKG